MSKYAFSGPAVCSIHETPWSGWVCGTPAWGLAACLLCWLNGNLETTEETVASWALCGGGLSNNDICSCSDVFDTLMVNASFIWSPNGGGNSNSACKIHMILELFLTPPPPPLTACQSALKTCEPEGLRDDWEEMWYSLKERLREVMVAFVDGRRGSKKKRTGRCIYYIQKRQNELKLLHSMF